MLAGFVEVINGAVIKCVAVDIDPFAAERQRCIVPPRLALADQRLGPIL